jgi:hypothetical protein
VDALTMLLDILSRQGGQDLAMFQGGFDISGSLNQQVKTTIGGLRVNQSDLAGGMFRRWGE